MLRQYFRARLAMIIQMQKYKKTHLINLSEHGEIVSAGRLTILIV